MTAGLTTSLRRCYDVHGIGVEVSTDDESVLDGMDLRLRGFKPLPGAFAPAVRLEFETSSDAALDPPPAGRPVYETRHGSLCCSDSDGAVQGTFGGVTLRCEPARGTARLSAARFTGADLYIATHPLATVSLMELFKRRSLFSLHAACLASDPYGGVLLAGPSGSGKSTLTLALAQAGLYALSDDIVFLSVPTAGRVRALGFSDALGLTSFAATRFPNLAGVSAEQPPLGFPKRLVRLDELYGPTGFASCEPTALVFCEVKPGGASRLEPLDPAQALLALVPDVLLTDPAASQAHLSAIGALLDQVTCFALRSGNDLERAAELVRSVATPS